MLTMGIFEFLLAQNVSLPLKYDGVFVKLSHLPDGSGKRKIGSGGNLGVGTRGVLNCTDGFTTITGVWASNCGGDEGGVLTALFSLIEALTTAETELF